MCSNERAGWGRGGPSERGGIGAEGRGRGATAEAFSLEQLKRWLARMSVRSTSNSLEYLLHHAGTNLQAMEQGQTLRLDRFVYAFERMTTLPVTI